MKNACQWLLDLVTVIELLLQRYRPDFVQLRARPNVTAILGRPHKIFSAAYAIENALRRGELKPGQPIIETSSGTFATVLAVLAQALGIELYLVVDFWVQPTLRFQLESMGAHVIFVEPHPTLGSQANRLRVLGDVVARTGAFWLNQYDEDRCAAGYWKLAAQIVDAGLRPDIIVLPVGTGASSKSLLTLLRSLWPELMGVGVDVLGSVNFAQQDNAALRKVSGIGNSILPLSVEPSLFDDVHMVSGEFAQATARGLLTNEGLWRGDSTGPCAHIADYYARHFPDKSVVFLSPDSGERYSATTWNPDHETIPVNELPTDPVEIQHPHGATGLWSKLQWDRRSFRDVLGHDPDPALYKRPLSSGRLV